MPLATCLHTTKAQASAAQSPQSRLLAGSCLAILALAVLAILAILALAILALASCNRPLRRLGRLGFVRRCPWRCRRGRWRCRRGQWKCRRGRWQCRRGWRSCRRSGAIVLRCRWKCPLRQHPMANQRVLDVLDRLIMVLQLLTLQRLLCPQRLQKCVRRRRTRRPRDALHILPFCFCCSC